MKLKMIIFVILLGTLIKSNAQDVLSTNPELPYAGQSIDLLVESWVCLSHITDSVVEVEGNVIRVFVVSGDPCATISPVPPMSSTAEFEAGQINGLSEGFYTFEFYRLQASDVFPPVPADYPLYLVNEIQFEVRGNLEPTSVNATSTLSIMALILMMLSVGYISIRTSVPN